MLDFRTLFESAPGAFLVILPDDPVFTIVAVSDAYVRASGMSREDLLGQGIFEVFPDNPESPVASRTYFLRASFQRVIATQAPDEIPVHRYDIQQPASEGGQFKERYWHSLNTPVLSADGQLAYLLHSAKEVTDQVGIERRNTFLVRLDDAVRPLIDPDDIIQTAVCLLGEHLQVDRCAYCYFEADEETLHITWDYIQSGVSSMVGRYRLTQFGAEAVRLLRAELPYIMEDSESDPRTADVRAIYRQAGVRAGASVPLHKAGRLVAVMAVHQLTLRQWQPDEVELVQVVADRCWESIERARVERELRASEEQFRTLAETIPNLVWIAHPDGHIFWYNRRWYEYTGTEPAQMEGWGWQSVHDPKVLPQVLERWEGSIDSGQPFEMVFPLKGADGVFRSFLTRVEPIKDDQSRVVRWFGTNTDITDQKRTEEELRRINRELEEFAYVASHDLQEPLRMVNIYTQLLLRQFSGESNEAQQYAAFVRQGVSRMEELIRDLLAFSRTIHAEDLRAGTAIAIF